MKKTNGLRRKKRPVVSELLTDEDSEAQRPRQVGVCLKHLTHDAGARFNNTTVPWQRVINSKGVISPRSIYFLRNLMRGCHHLYILTGWSRSQPAGTQNQAAALRAEGVTVTTGALGELIVDFGEYGWFPAILPSEAGQEDGVDDEVEEGDGQSE